jgi:8-oxo-dGTP pyrophosphatase MutT (NUDIX family)
VHSVAMTVVARNYKNLRLAKLRKARECEQVAAVCYRVRRGALEFLLVQTRGSRRWTFPKGKAEAGLTHAQAAAIEAFEEAGVHGRMEEASFVRYFSRSKSVARGIAVSAHLCEVLRLSTPKECNRNRTWFSAREAKDRLREGRGDEDAAEFARVIGRASTRIERLRGGSGAVANVDQAVRSAIVRGGMERDALQRVQFEAGDARLQTLLTTNDRRRIGPSRQVVSSRIGGRPAVGYGEVLEFSSQRRIDPRPKLLSDAGSQKPRPVSARNAETRTGHPRDSER